MTTLIADEVISFTVLGCAKPAGSKRAFPIRRTDGSVGVRVTDDCKGSRSWKQCVAHAAREAYRGPLLEGPLAVTFCFHVVRPKGHFGTKGNVKASAPRYPITRPDVLKLARAVEDAIVGVVIRDDAQIIEERLVKRYSETAKTKVWIVVREHYRPDESLSPATKEARLFR